jgi:hypothetical protein
MTCDACREWISAAMDGISCPVEDTAAERHLSICPGCRDARDAALALRDTLRDAVIASPEADARDAALLAVLSAEGLFGETRRGRLRLLAEATREGVALEPRRLKPRATKAQSPPSRTGFAIGAGRLRILMSHGFDRRCTADRLAGAGPCASVTRDFGRGVSVSVSLIHRVAADLRRALPAALRPALATMAATFLLTRVALRGAEGDGPARVPAVPRTVVAERESAHSGPLPVEPEAEMIERWIAAGAPAMLSLARPLPEPPKPAPKPAARARRRASGARDGSRRDV